MSRSYLLLIPPHLPRITLFPYTTLFRSQVNYIVEVMIKFLRMIQVGPQSILVALMKVIGDLSTQDLIGACAALRDRSEEHTSELQSRRDLVCRLLLEKKNSTKLCISLNL